MITKNLTAIFGGRLTVTFSPLGQPRPEHELLLLVPFGVPGGRLLRGGPVTFVSSQGRLMPAVLVEAGRDLVLRMVTAGDNMKPAFIDGFLHASPMNMVKMLKQNMMAGDVPLFDVFWAWLLR